ncbi:MAG TPA: FKBP-type peptidyl-prolyl cis-trans isomerase, partial [Polyangiaceae bacterium]
ALASAMAALSANAPPPGPEGKLEVQETAAGKGTPAKNGDTVNVNYVGKLTNGQIFDQSKGSPFSFQLGAGRVIKGWDQGLLGMKPGSKRTLTIPPSLAYGARGMPPVIPPNSTLVFDVEMLSITPGK